MGEDVQFDWDDANRNHLARHAVTPEEAEQALQNDPLDENFDLVNGEERWTSIGHADRLRVLDPQVDDARKERESSDCVGGRTQEPFELFPRERNTMKKFSIPKFKTEEEEAEWWYAHREQVEARLVDALRRGETKSGTPRRLASEARPTKNITINMPVSELDRVRHQAEIKGLGYQTYMKLLLRDALDREEAASRGKRVRRTG